ncbi:hypothetical protein NM688_g1450 [Phlebia brevispora]|uniref:Uncharacterized protein n=1 Tax=Phlebia brevispora TaxID=194682 RepID=A0ACC1TB52_9APHY|nr:hypothetical protein NM688_g1450 [Phlebia brevispora]
MSSEKDTAATAAIITSEVPLVASDVLRDIKAPASLPHKDPLANADANPLANPTSPTDLLVSDAPAARRLSAGEAFAEKVGIDLNKVGRAEARKIMSVEHKVLGFRPPHDSLAAAAQAAAARHADETDEGQSSGAKGKKLSVDADKLREAAREDAQRILAERTKQGSTSPTAAMLSTNSTTKASVIFSESDTNGHNKRERDGVDLERVTIEDARKLMSTEHRALGFRPPPGSLAAEAQAAATKAANAVTKVPPSSAAKSSGEPSKQGSTSEASPRRRRYSNQPGNRKPSEGNRRSMSLGNGGIRRASDENASGRPTVVRSQEDRDKEEVLTAAAIRDAERIRATRGVDGATAMDYAHIDVHDSANPESLAETGMPAEVELQKQALIASRFPDTHTPEVNDLQAQVQQASEAQTSRQNLANPFNEVHNVHITTSTPPPAGNDDSIFLTEDVPQQHEQAKSAAVAGAQQKGEQMQGSKQQANMVLGTIAQTAKRADETMKNENVSDALHTAVEADVARKETEREAGEGKDCTKAPLGALAVDNPDIGGESGEDVGEDSMVEEGGYVEDTEDQEDFEVVDEKRHPEMVRTETADSVQIIGDVPLGPPSSGFLQALPYGMQFQDCSATVPFQHVRVTDPFWVSRFEAIRTGSLPAMYNQMKQTGRWDALKLQWKPGEPNPPHRFWDSDVAKWVEAACCVLVTAPNSELARQVEEAVDNIRNAQHEDGYINTYYTVVEPGKRWTNLSWSHELYDAGHLLEAAVAHNIYSQSTRLLAPLLKYVKYIESVFGLREGLKAGYPGHQELELALLKAYEQLGDRALLELANYFIEERGQPRPQGLYFDVEARARGEPPNPGPSPKGAPRYSYHQADRPVREMRSVEGHSVRAMYWLTAVANLARLTKDSSLLRAAEDLWVSTTERKMYVTGGLGSMGDWEGFGPDYVLPNETGTAGYLETCAAIGLVFFAYQMLLIQPRATKYADVLELALYNAVLVGVSLDGRKFFYENPLATVGKLYGRSAWFDCSCCPPNVARLVATVGKYIFTVGADDTIFVHLYISCSAEIPLSGGKSVTVVLDAKGPWEGGATIRVSGDVEHAKFSFRKPLGAVDFKVHSGGIVTASNPHDGRVEIGAVTGIVQIDYKYAACILKPHPLNLDNLGCIAFARGPFIYCAETIDNAMVSDLRGLRVSEEHTIKEYVDDVSFAQWGIQPVVMEVNATTLAPDGSKGDRVAAKLIPLFLWANRGSSDLRVWLAADTK